MGLFSAARGLGTWKRDTHLLDIAIGHRKTKEESGRESGKGGEEQERSVNSRVWKRSGASAACREGVLLLRLRQIPLLPPTKAARKVRPSQHMRRSSGRASVCSAVTVHITRAVCRVGMPTLPSTISSLMTVLPFASALCVFFPSASSPSPRTRVFASPRCRFI